MFCIVLFNCFVYFRYYNTKMSINLNFLRNYKIRTYIMRCKRFFSKYSNISDITKRKCLTENVYHALVLIISDIYKMLQTV